MLNLLKALRQDEHGVILSAELVIVGTVLVVGLMTGLACLQKSVNGELGDLAKAIDSIDQTYSFSGHQKAGRFNGNGDCCAFTAGSAFMNNECNTIAGKSDIVGFEGQMLLHSGSAGVCGSCGGRCGAGGFCGSCGAAGYGSGDGYGYRDPNRPNCVSTGVPKMKVTEYPGTSNVPHTSNQGKSAIRFPGFEDQQLSEDFGSPVGHEFEPDCPRVLQDGLEVHENLDQPGRATPQLPGPFHSPGLPEAHDDRSGLNESDSHGSAPAEHGSVDEKTPLRPIPENQPLPESPPGNEKE